jgi:serine/threonine protein kinase
MTMKIQPPKGDGPLTMGGVALSPGARIGNYIFVREIGSGGMARVLLVKDPSGDLSALKILRRNRFKSGIGRFSREFKALSRISHNNVISVLAFGDLFGHPYFAMEYVNGTDLHTQIRQFRTWSDTRRYERAESVLIDLCYALEAIHKCGMVHRDLKPSNVLVASDGTCKLTDFGIVKELDSTEIAQASTTLVGTWAYAAPEQITGAAVDHRADLYSLGIILFTMLVGKRPFVAKDMAGYLTLHRDREAPSPRSKKANVPAHLEAITMCLLAKSPRDRYQSARDVLDALELAKETPKQTRSDSWQPPLVGRTAEHQQLNDLIAGLTDHRSALLFITGEDGIGKSRLLRVGQERAESLGIILHRIRFAPNRPLFSQILPWARQLNDALGPDAPPSLLLALRTFNSPNQRGGDSRYALFDGLGAALHEQMLTAPVLLLIDDLHYAARRELDMVRTLVRTLIPSVDGRLLIAATLRPLANQETDAMVRGHGIDVDVTTMPLKPLSEPEVHTVVTSLVGDGEATQDLTGRLYKQTDGNPYFVTEFLRNLVVESNKPDAPFTLNPKSLSDNHLEIPLGVRALMQRRLDAVNKQDRPLLELVAIGSHHLNVDMIIEILAGDDDDVLRSIDTLIAAGIIVTQPDIHPPRYHVTHRNFAELIVSNIETEARYALHGAIASTLAIETTDCPAALEALGEHYRLAGVADLAYRHLVDAAKRLASHSLIPEAAILMARVDAIAKEASRTMSPEQVALLRMESALIHGIVAYTHGEWSRANEVYYAALRDARSLHMKKTEIDLHVRLSATSRHLGDPIRAKAYATAARNAAVEENYTYGEAQAIQELATHALLRGELERSEQLSDEGLKIATTTALSHPRAALLLSKGSVVAIMGRLAEATRCYTTAETIFQALHERRMACITICNAAELLLWQGEPAQSLVRAQDAHDLAVDIAHHQGKAVALRLIANAKMHLGEHQAAHQTLSISKNEPYSLSDDVQYLAIAIIEITLSLHAGNPSEAITAGRTALDACKTDSEQARPLIWALLAPAYASANDEKTARKLLTSAEGQLTQMPMPRRNETHIAIAEGYLSLNLPNQTKKHARRALQTADGHGFALRSIKARLLLAETSTGEERQMHIHVATDLLKGMLGNISTTKITDHHIMQKLTTLSA